MKCARCQFENKPGAKFCGNCGAVIAETPVLSASSSPGQIKCRNCNTLNPEDSQFCERCGSRIITTNTAAIIPISQSYVPKKTSAAWWLMPIFLGWIGGLVGWLVVRETDKRKAKGLLWFGIGITGLWIIMYIIAALIPFILGDF